MKRKLFISFHFQFLMSFFLFCLTLTATAQKAPKREFRGAWIQTVFQEEYALMSVEEMKSDFIRKLNILQECGINALIFQVRPEADAWYESSYEPWSRFCTGTQGVAPGALFDPMAFLIKECHKRNMEFHAWLNPFRAGTSGTMHLCEEHVYHKHPEWFVHYNKQLLFDPGLPECRGYICQVVQDIILRYDVDAIHMDDYFYPYPVAGMPFPDDHSFMEYGIRRGYTQEERDDWRRENVNTLVRQLKNSIALVKPWVRFGISPFGIYRNKKDTPDGSGSETDGTQNYDDLYADILLWTQNQWIDYNIPQLYWETGHPAADYITLIKWWNKNANGIPMYIGQDVSRTMKANDLTVKLNLERRLSQCQGHCFWPANEIFRNNGGIADSLRERYHRYPALIPPYTHMKQEAPAKVRNLAREEYKDGVAIRWEAIQNPKKTDAAHYFVIYKFKRKRKINPEDPTAILAITRYPECFLAHQKTKKKYWMMVTAVDRYHNESAGEIIKVKF